MIQEEPVAVSSIRRDIISKIRQKIARAKWEAIGLKLLGTICVFILGGLLVAGLWPFHSPKNQVTWFAGGNGLQFGRHGTILSSGNIKAANAQEDDPCSFEIWLEPDFTAGGGTLLAFYAPGSHQQFSLQQSITDLALRIDFRDGRFRTRINRFYVGDIFRRGKPLFITATSNGGQTSVYLDGALADTAPQFPLSGKDFEGELVIATSPRIDNSWSGLLRGLAFYDQELSPAQVLHHYETWIKKGRPDVSENERAVALYLFDEHAGPVIHNQVPSGTGMYIPDRYQVLDEVFLKPFWEEFYPRWSYCRDVLINIIGFIPFGFLFCAYLSLAGRIKKPALVTILLGFMVSLTIESLQAYLPTRDSGTTDLITNTLGTCLGVWLYRLNIWRVLFAKIWTPLVRIVSTGKVVSYTD
ncbi:MAG: VanZ family protein [Terriglobia bacterium]|jgi:VanZ family protein